MTQLDVYRGSVGTTGAEWGRTLSMPYAYPPSIAPSPHLNQIQLLDRLGIHCADFPQSEPPSLPSIAPRAGHRITGPVQFVIRLLLWWNLDRDAAVPLLGFHEGDAADVNEILRGSRPLCGDDVRDRIAHLFRIRSILSGLFRDLDVENQWLREDHELLDGHSPLSLMLGSTKDLLLAKEYTETFAGL